MRYSRAKLLGATKIIVVDNINERLELAKKLGADITINFSLTNPVEEVMHHTNGIGVDVAIEALGQQKTFENCLRVLKPGGKERMRRLLSFIQSRRIDVKSLVTHRFKLDDIEEAYDLFAHQQDGVKVAIVP